MTPICYVESCDQPARYELANFEWWVCVECLYVVLWQFGNRSVPLVAWWMRYQRERIAS